MFDIGWSEIIVIIIVNSIFLDFKDIPKIIKYIKKISCYFRELLDEIKVFFSDFEQETNKIIDLEGNEQLTYDLDDIMPDIKEAKKKKKKQGDKEIIDGQ